MRGRDFIESHEGVGVGVGGEALRCYCYRHIIGDVVHYRSIRHHVLLTIIMTAIMANVGLHMGLSHNVYIQYTYMCTYSVISVCPLYMSIGHLNGAANL